MRYLLCVLALTSPVSAATAQQPVPSAAPSATAVMVDVNAPPECGAPNRATSPADTLCLTRAGAIAQAIGANPQVQIAGAQTQQTRAQKVQSTAFPDPVVSAEWDNARGPFGLGSPSGRLLGATLSVPFPDKFRLNGKIGRASVRASEFDSAVVQQAIASQASQSYDNVLRAIRQLASLRRADSLVRDFAKKTRFRFDAGTVARLDVINADVAVGQVGNSLIASERNLVDARSALNRLLGRPLAAPIATADSLDLPAPLPELAAIERSAMQHRPELASLESRRAGARAATQLAKEFWFPEFFATIERDYLAERSPGYLTTGLSLPIPVFYWNHSKGEIAEAKYREMELDATSRDVAAAVGQDVRLAFSAASTARRQAVYLRDELLPAARQAYRIAASSYAVGGLSALEVNAARTALLEAETMYTDALADANSARAELERAAATPLATLGTGAPQ